jgi:2-dehydro-3-deoxygalactonokinase
MEPNRAALIGLDWGTSRLRAYLFDDQGSVLAVKERPWGVLAMPEGGFARAFHAAVSDWRTAKPDLPAIAGGMIGSTEGWVAVPYCACPAGPVELAAGLVSAATGDGVVHVIPGVEQRGAAPDVMRGEETQIAGALALFPERAANWTLVLPGTHAKWVAVRDGRIARFTTYLTGELFALLSEHSILGRPARNTTREPANRAAENAGDAFERGVGVAREAAGGIAPLLFRTRSMVLTKALRPEESLEFLSGLLIGDEVHSALPPAAANLALIGDPALCERYRRALAAFGIDAQIVEAATPAGLWTIACRAGLVAASAAHA